MKTKNFCASIVCLMLCLASGRTGYAQQSAQDFFNRALIKQKAGDLTGAITDYSRAIELDPKYVFAYNNRGLAKSANGDLDGAIADYSRAIELDPKQVVTYAARGLAKSTKGDLDAAIADYDRAIELNPKDPYAYRYRGLAKSAKGDLDSAIADYSHAIELDPKFALAYCDRGIDKKTKGDFAGAIADYTRTIELDPNYAGAYSGRGIAKAAKGDLDSAIADYTRAIELDPKYADAYNNRGIAKVAKGDLDSAIADYTRAIELKKVVAAAKSDNASTSDWLPSSGIFGTEKGRFILQATEKGDGYRFGRIFWKQEFSSVPNYEVSVKFRRLDGQDDYPMELFFLGGSFAITEGGSYFFWEQVGGQFSGWKSSSAIQAGQDNEVKLRHVGSNLTAWINGTQVATFQLKRPIGDADNKFSVFIKGDTTGPNPKLAFWDFQVTPLK